MIIRNSAEVRIFWKILGKRISSCKSLVQKKLIHTSCAQNRESILNLKLKVNQNQYIEGNAIFDVPSASFYYFHSFCLQVDKRKSSKRHYTFCLSIF
jgi:hypothetical protein